MTSVPPTQPPAAPETDVRLTEAERTILTAHFWGRRITANATHLADLIAPAVERIVAERVRVVEGERDAARREERMRAEDHANAWREVAIVTARAESAEAAHAALVAGLDDAIEELIECRSFIWAETRHEPTVAAINAKVAHLRALVGGTR